MKVQIHDWHTTILLSWDEFKEYCKPGQGEDTCIWAVAGPDGFECTYYNKPISLVQRFEAGKTVAKRDGCDKVKNFSPAGLTAGTYLEL